MNFHKVLRKENIVKEKKESEAKRTIPYFQSYHCGQTCGSVRRGVQGLEGRERRGEEEAGEEGERYGHG